MKLGLVLGHNILSSDKYMFEYQSTKIINAVYL